MSEQPQHNKILSDALMDIIGEALGVPVGNARRIVLDIEIKKPIRVYIEYLGDTRFLDIQLPPLAGADGIDIRTSQ